MSDLKLEWDTRALSAFSHLNRPVFKALSKAGGDAIRAYRVDANRYARSRKKLKVARVNKALTLRFPRGAREIDELVWNLDVRALPVPLADYPSRQNRKGVRVQVNVGSTKLIKSAFIATMRSGHRGVFVREGLGRLPIRELFSTRVDQVLQDNGAIPGLEDRAQRVFASSYARLLPLELAKQGR